jgi:hypothetical protein
MLCYARKTGVTVSMPVRIMPDGELITLWFLIASYPKSKTPQFITKLWVAIIARSN